MPIIDKTKLPLEITSKYSIANNAFSLSKIKNAELDTYKNEPKDEINIFVGDDKIPDTFIPQLKLERWSNETNFSIRLVDDEVGQETVNTLADKIVWEKGNKKIEFYDFVEGEGGYKLVWFLKKKPKMNKVEFTIQSKGLDFLYQPELTPEEIAQGAVRPENVIGSYAVYHQTKGGMNDIYGKDYKVGKAFHIFRPRIIDANGAETWGILHIENGIYSVEIPQDFLDNAVYPIKSNDTFGYTSIGVSANNSTNFIIGSVFTGANGTATSITTYFKKTNNDASGSFKAAIYLHSDLSYIDKTSIYSMAIYSGSHEGWHELSLLSSQSISAVDYVLVGWSTASANQVNIFYDAGSADQGHTQTLTYATNFPNPYNPSHTTNKHSIYATYTPSGGGTVVKDLIQSGIIAFPR